MNKNYNALQLAQMAFHAGKLDEASALCHQLLSAQPNNAEARSIMGSIALRQQNFQAAKQWLESSLKLNPNSANGFYLLAIVWTHLNDVAKTIFCLKKSVALDPKRIDVVKSLIELLIQEVRFVEAIEIIKVALKQEPSSTKFLSDLSYTCLESGRVEEAIEAYKKALGFSPELSYLRSNMLVALNYHQHEDLEAIFTIYKEQAAQIRKHSPATSASVGNKVASHQKIRLGYVSPDFHNHSVSYFFSPLLKHHDREKYELYAYYTNQVDDSFTQFCKQRFDKWVEAAELSDGELIERIQADEIDVLIDLTGHMSRNRLGVFAAKPSPIQVTWLGFPNTSGLEEMDYRLVDAITDPDGAEQYYTEELIRLPHGFLCYEGPEHINLNPNLPAKQDAPFTFGSFNNYTKITDKVLSTWAEILKQVPESRFALKSRQLSDPEIRKSVVSRFESLGISPERIIVLPPTRELKDHWETYNNIDLALDSFPYNGTTTTCEALWMGVPTVCFVGSVHASRVSASIMSHVGLSEFVAKDESEYIDKCIQWANNLDELENIRSGMRSRLAKSSLCNAEQFTLNIEDAYQQMIKEFLE